MIHTYISIPSNNNSLRRAPSILFDNTFLVSRSITKLLPSSREDRCSSMSHFDKNKGETRYRTLNRLFYQLYSRQETLWYSIELGPPEGCKASYIESDNTDYKRVVKILSPQTGHCRARRTCTCIKKVITQPGQTMG